MTEVLCTMTIQSNNPIEDEVNVKAIQAALQAWGAIQGLYLWSVRTSALKYGASVSATFETVPPVTTDG